jgi:hypothetical protein
MSNNNDRNLNYAIINGPYFGQFTILSNSNVQITSEIATTLITETQIFTIEPEVNYL